MKNNTFFKSTLILLIGGAITKLLGMVIKIVMNRMVGISGVSLYMLIFPTFALFMTISQLSFPIAISKLVAEEKYNNRNLIFSIIPVSLVFNALLIIFIIFLAPIIARFLNDERAVYPILAIGFVLPFDCLSSILRGYFFGKERMIPHILSLILEQIIRLVLIVIITPTLLSFSIVYSVVGLVLVNMFSEAISICFLLLFIKNKKINKKDFIINYSSVKDVLSISFPNTGARLIGSICYFFEPILLNYFLSINGYSNNYIVIEYGVIEGFVLPILSLPNFFTNALSNALLPNISKSYSSKDIRSVKRKLKQVVFFSLAIGVPLSIILFLYPSFLLSKIYNTSYGSNYLSFLSLFFIFLYVQAPFSSVLQAINKSKSIMYHNLIGILFKLFIIIIFSFFNIGLYNFLIGMIANIVIVTFLHFRTLKKELV